MNVQNHKTYHYNFPVLDSTKIPKLPNTFFTLKTFIPLKLNNIKNNFNNKFTKYSTILDSGSYCNFISKDLVSKLNLQKHKAINSIEIKGISGSAFIKEIVVLKFQLRISINNKFYIATFKDGFLVTDKIPTDILLGNKFMNKYEIQFNYKNKFIFSNLNFNSFKKKSVSITNLNNKINFSNFNYYKNFPKIFSKNFFNKKPKFLYFLNKLKFNKKQFHKKYFNNNFYSIKPKNSYYNYYSPKYKSSSKFYNYYSKFRKNSKFNFRNYFSKNSKKFKNYYKFKKFRVTKKFTNNKNYFTTKNFSKNKVISKRNFKKFNYNLFIYSFLNNFEDTFTEEDDEIDEEEDKIEDIPEPYRDLFEVFSKKNADKLPPHRLVDCKIVLQKDATLHYCPIYPLSEEEDEVLKQYIKDNEKKGFIRLSESPAGYPILFQKKKDGTLRLCVDYRKLNDVTVRNSYPLPLINDIIEKVKGAQYFTKLDLRSAYNLIRIREGDEYKTAFRTKYGHYEYLVMPFGLKNAPATFQSFINSVLRPFLEKSVILYLDDILIYSKTLDEHIQHVREVLQKLLENNLYAKLKKCEFHKNEVQFLGYVISGKGISTDPEKIKSVKEWPTPTCVKDVQRFVGLCNYYRRFVENFAQIARPLHNLTKKNNKFIWDNKCENAFQELKNRLTTAPVLIHPDPSKPFIVECDASNYAIGGILSQKDDEGKLHPVAYYSRSLSNVEVNYSITEKELLAIKCAFSNWRHLLLGAKHQVTVFTDHKNLIYTLGGKVGNQRQQRWHMFFQEFNFQLIYRQGKKNGKPDSLSRRPDYLQKPEYEQPEYILDSSNIDPSSCLMGISNTLIDEIIEATKTDSTADDIYHYFGPINASQGYYYRPFRKMNKFKIKNNMIWYGNLIYVPEKLRLEILKRYHENPAAGHLGIRRTEELIMRNFWWPKMHQDITSFVNSCENCARNKVSRHKKYDFLRPLEIPDRPWRSIEIDFLCGLPESKKYTVIMVVVDRFSKMIHLIPFKIIPTAEETAEAFLKEIFRIHGLPSDIYSDRGSQFTSALWTEILEKLRIASKIATTDHHETVGQVERCNSFIAQYLRCYTRAFFHDDWIKWLHLAEFVYNNSVHESTKQTPFFINYGFHPPMDEIFLFQGSNSNFEYIEDVGKNFLHVKEVLLRAQDLYKRAADKKRMIAPEFKEGEKVWVNAPPAFTTAESAKLAPRKYGPYKVLEVLKNGNYRIDISKSPFPKHYPIFHVSELEPYVPTPEKFKGRTRYRETAARITEILDFRPNYKEKRYEYKVRYNYKQQCNWVPASVIENDIQYQEMLINFNKSIRKF